MKYLHAMIRVLDLEKAIGFFELLGFQVQRKKEHEKGRFTLVFMSTAPGEPEVELTYNWDQKEAYSGGRNFGHLAYQVENIYDTCARLEAKGISILRPPRDGHMAFVRSPDQISIELLQIGSPLDPQEPWLSRPNQGEW